MKYPVLKINGPENIRNVLIKLGTDIKLGLEGGPLEVHLQRESKNRNQEAKYHAMIGDIAKTVILEGRTYPLEIWKELLVDAFEEELKQMREDLRHGGYVLPSLDKRRVVVVRAKTSKFLKKEAGDFIQFLYMKGIEYGAKFTDKSLDIYEQEMNR